jgi:RNA polymerase sigma-70 factor (ECF subfamily)
MNTHLEVAPKTTDRGGRAKKKSKHMQAQSEQRSLECRELFSNLSEYLDGRVEPATCDAMRRHIEACPACVAFLQSLRTAIDRCRSLTISCDPTVALRLRSILTQEYLRLLSMPGTEKCSAVL